jgi:formylglycine-generating enzyme required for sulfatase activity
MSNTHPENGPARIDGWLVQALRAARSPERNRCASPKFYSLCLAKTKSACEINNIQKRPVTHVTWMRIASCEFLAKDNGKYQSPVEAERDFRQLVERERE